MDKTDAESAETLAVAPRRRSRLLLASLLLAALLVPAGWWGGRQLWAWHHLSAARDALARREFEQARQHLIRCRQVWPERGTVRLLSARAARRAAAFDEAEEHLKACPPGEDTILEWALLQAQRGEMDIDHEAYFKSNVRRGHPETVAILEVLTWHLMQWYRLGEASQFLDFWLEVRPDDHEAHVRRGWVAERLFALHDAVAAYHEALALAPERDSVRLRRAEVLMQIMRPAEARAELEILRQRRPDAPADALALARCCRLEGRTDEAQELLDALFAVVPHDPAALSERGQLALELGRPAEAEVWLRRALDRKPYERDIVHNLLLCLRQQGKADEARNMHERLRRIEDDEKSMKELMNAVLKRRFDPAPRYEIGVIFLRNGMTEDGLRWLHTVLRIDAAHPGAHAALANHYRRSGQADLAERHARLAGPR